MTEEKQKFLEPILATFENEDLKEFAIKLVDDFPQYIWEVGASSTGKYHPAYTLGTYGLMKHQVAVVRFINFFFELEQYKNRYNSRQRDCLRVAALVHDGRKSGTQEDYEKSKYTKFDHPILMAKEIMAYRDKNIIPNEDIIFISKAIISHMGQWNTDKRSDLTLPKPNMEAQELLHLADYLASRKCINVDFSDYIIPSVVDINTYKMPFGKYKDTLITEVPKDYIEWLSGQDDLKEPLNTFIKDILKR